MTAFERRLQIEYMDPRRLSPAEYNPRVMSEQEMAKLRRSLAEFGFVDPVIVRREGLQIVGGHQRVRAAVEQGIQEVPVVLLDIPAAEAKALNVALNRIHGDWDLDKLGAVLEELRDLPDVDETLTGFDQRDLQDLLGDLEAKRPAWEEEPEEIEIPDPARVPRRVQAGQLWQLGRHRLLCADSLHSVSLARVCGGERADIVLTDAPYGLDYRPVVHRARGSRGMVNDNFDGFADFLERALTAIKEQMKPGAVLYWFAGGGNTRPVLGLAMLAVHRHFQLLNCLVWDKEVPGLTERWRHSWEAILEASLGPPRCWHGGTGRRNVLRYPRPAFTHEAHPTPKPVGLLAELLRAASDPGALVLDPFGGAGATLIAAERAGRSCRVAEIEPRYCDIALTRWERLSGKQARKVDGDE